MDRRVLTYTGKYIDVFELTPADICLKDIAHALAVKTRFNGAAKTFYSVAEHCVLAATYCTMRSRIAGVGRWCACLPQVALLHDAGEAYFMDVPRPWKDEQGWKYAAWEAEEATRKIFDKYLPATIDLPSNDPDMDYGYVDDQLLIAECRALLNNWQACSFASKLLELPICIGPTWPWERAEMEFLKKAEELGIRDC